MVVLKRAECCTDGTVPAHIKFGYTMNGHVRVMCGTCGAQVSKQTERVLAANSVTYAYVRPS